MLLLLPLLGALFLPWAAIQTPGGAARARGFEYLGALALPLMLALWGLAVTSLLATSDRAARLGAALTDVAVAAATALLLATSHAWVSDGLVARAQAPALAGLAALALLQAACLGARSPHEREVAWIRAGAAFVAGVIFLYADAYLAGGISLWLAFSAASVALYRPRRELDVLSVIAAAAALFAAVQSGSGSVGVFLGYYVWIVVSGLLAALGAGGVARARRVEETTPTTAR